MQHPLLPGILSCILLQFKHEYAQLNSLLLACSVLVNRLLGSNHTSQHLLGRNPSSVSGVDTV